MKRKTSVDGRKVGGKVRKTPGNTRTMHGEMQMAAAAAMVVGDRVNRLAGKLKKLTLQVTMINGKATRRLVKQPEDNIAGTC